MSSSIIAATAGTIWPSGRKQKRKRNRRPQLRILEARIVKRRERAANQRKKEKRRLEREQQLRRAA